jgi:thioredoxin 1
MSSSSSGVVQKLAQADWDSKVARSEAPVLVAFTASWCGACQRLAPTLALVAQRAEDADVFDVDVDGEKALTRSHQVRLLPTVLVMRRGLEAARLVGPRTLNAYLIALDDARNTSAVPDAVED